MRAKLERNEQISANIKTSSSRYCHSGVMTVEIASADAQGESDDEWNSEHDEQEMLEIFRAFADWMYKQLEEQHDFLHSDEHIDECLADESFDEDGFII
jgi:hypothetical protein